MTPTVRLVALIDHLGIGVAHVATQMPGDIAGLASGFGARLGGIGDVVALVNNSGTVAAGGHPFVWRQEGTRGTLSKRAYMRFAQRYVPDIDVSDVVRARSGVRAQAVERDGSLVDDFRIHQVGPVVAVRNAPSKAG